MKQVRHMRKTIVYVLRCAPGLVLCKFIVALLTAFIVPATALLMQGLVDSVAGGESLPAVFLFLALLLVMKLLGTSGGIAGTALDIRLKRALSVHVTDEIVDKYRRLDYASFEREDTYDTIHRAGRQPEETILNAFLETVSLMVYLAAVVGNVVVFFQLGAVFSIGYLLLLVPLFFLNYRSYRIVMALFEVQTEEERRMEYYQKLFSEKSSVFELKVFRAVPFVFGAWRKTTDKVLDYRVKTTVKGQKWMLFGSLAYILWIAWLLTEIVIKGVEGEITLGLCTALIAAITTMVSNIDNFVWGLDSVSRKLVQAGYLEAFLALPERKRQEQKQKQTEHGQEQGVPEGNRHEIRFEHVTFTYPGADKPALKDVTAAFTTDSHIAVVGSNGAGKSTMVKLLCRLYEPDCGRITIDGIPIQKIGEQQWRAIVGVVFQDYGTYKMTLRENVAFGSMDKIRDDEALYEALRKAGFPEEKLDLNVSYGKLEEGSSDLSGGQWQRVTLARAYVSDCGFLILDEPTAALDPIAENDMYLSFLSIMKERGCMIISHRLASARMADSILVLDNGEIAEQGSHQELLDRKGHYAFMWEAQSRFYQGGEGQ